MTPEDARKSRKCSIRLELQNQSKRWVKRLSVLEKHELLIDPIKFHQKMLDSVKNDKSSILSSSSGFSSTKKESLIDSKKHQTRMMKNSIAEIMGSKERWNPNANIKAESYYTFNNSPQPKRGSFITPSIKSRGSVLIQLQPTGP